MNKKVTFEEFYGNGVAWVIEDIEASGFRVGAETESGHVPIQLTFRQLARLWKTLRFLTKDICLDVERCLEVEDGVRFADIPKTLAWQELKDQPIPDDWAKAWAKTHRAGQGVEVPEE